MKILLWKIGALGDVLMTTPLVRQLRRALPHARIDYLVGRGARAALSGNPHLDQVTEFDERILHHAQLHRLASVLALLRGYDTVYVLDKHWVFGWMARAAGVPHRIGFQRRTVEGWPHTIQVPYGGLRHEIDYYLDLAEAAGLPVARENLAIEFSGEVAFPLQPGTTVLVNSGGANGYERSDVRRMPDTLFADLVRACTHDGPVAFIGGNAEAAYYEQFVSRQCTNLCGRTTIPQAASVLRQAMRVITTDTGLMHLAAAVNPCVTAVFGPTHPQRKCPPGTRWVWCDAETYDPAYELFGRVPKTRFFQSLRAEHVLPGAQGSSPDRT